MTYLQVKDLKKTGTVGMIVFPTCEQACRKGNIPRSSLTRDQGKRVQVSSPCLISGLLLTTQLHLS